MIEVSIDNSPVGFRHKSLRLRETLSLELLLFDEVKGVHSFASVAQAPVA